MNTGRPGRALGRALGVASLVAVALGCTSGPLHIDNGTDTSVSLYHDDQWVGTYAAGASGSASLSGKGGPSTLEVRSPSGAVLLSLPIDDDQLNAAAGGDYGNGTSVGLPCGVVTVVIGRLATDAALAPAESAPPGACP